MRLAAAASLALLCAAPAHADPALVDAARDGDRAQVLALLDGGADAKAPEANGTTALHYAVYNDDAELVERLLAAGADPRAKNVFGATPLSEAAVAGNARVTTALLDAGADPNERDADGQTPLMVAARTGKLDAVEALLAHGADPNARESWGEQTALMWAAGQCHTPVVRELISKGADVSARGADRVWKRRVHAEPRPKDMDGGGFTALIYAARAGCTETARALVEGGADLNQHDRDRGTPLLLALMNLRFETAAYLVEAGADLDKWDIYGESPVYMAVDVSTLPDGGRPDIPSLEATTAVDVLKLMLEKGANPNIRLEMRPPFRNVIFDRGGDQVLSFGATALLRAAKASDNAAIEVLLAHGALVDLPNEDGVTPLMAAAGMGHGSNPTRGRWKTDAQGAESVRLLAAAGADVNAKSRSGQTALHAAAQKGWTETVRALAAAGADLEAKDARGVTPLQAAQGKGAPEGRGPAPTPQPETAKALEALIAG